MTENNPAYNLPKYKKITAEFLKSILDYDSKTGIFCWKFRKDARSQWNGKFSGKIAGCYHADGHLQIVIRPWHYKGHVLAWIIMTGQFPKNEIDHINGDRRDNRWENLRAATHRQNILNSKLRIDNTSGFKGVVWDKRRHKWISRIKIEGKIKQLGSFKNPEDAHREYCNVAKKYYGRFARFK